MKRKEKTERRGRGRAGGEGRAGSRIEKIELWHVALAKKRQGMLEEFLEAHVQRPPIMVGKPVLQASVQYSGPLGRRDHRSLSSLLHPLLHGGHDDGRQVAWHGLYGRVWGRRHLGHGLGVVLL